jgi:hypothetical protein
MSQDTNAENLENQDTNAKNLENIVAGAEQNLDKAVEEGVMPPEQAARILRAFYDTQAKING